MKKGLKFLLCLILSIFIGIGVVVADEAPNTITLSAGPVDGNNNGWDVYSDIRPDWPFYRKLYDFGGQPRYLFCLDSHKNFAFGETLQKASGMTNQSELQTKVGNVYARAYQFGLGEGESHSFKIGDVPYSNVSEHDLYAITQMAIWNIMHGTGEDGYVSDYSTWITNNNYTGIFNDFMTVATNGAPTNYDNNYNDYALNGSTGLTESSDGRFLVSNEFEFYANPVYRDDFEFTVTATSPRTGVQKNGGEWTSSVTVRKNDHIKIRVEKDNNVEHGTVHATVSYGSKKENFTAGWTAYFYSRNQNDQQNIAMPIPTTRSVQSKTLELNGEYSNVTLRVSKTDATGQNELSGAHLTLKNYEGSEIENWESTTSVHVVRGLVVGNFYEIIEDYAPDGYAPLQNSIKFVLNADGSVTTCKAVTKDSNNNNVCDEMSTDEILQIKNDVTKLDISKRDVTTGEEIVGAELKICTIAAYEQDGKDCKPDKDEWSWVSGEEPHRIEGLTIGKYVLIETLPMEGYAVEMYINDEATSAYEFEITESGPLKIDVYNKLLKDVPKTGISVINLIAIGGLMVFIGYETINIYRKKVNTK